MNKLRIGVVGLGGIAQKAWLPVLVTSADWTLQGAFSPSRDKAQRICDTADTLRGFTGESGTNLRRGFRPFQHRDSLCGRQ